MPGQILVVDSVITNRAVLVSKLTAAYYDVKDCATGDAVLKAADFQKTDLILIDETLSDMSGVTLCKRLKSAPETAHIPVILLNSANRPGHLSDAYEAGADDYLSKPICYLALFSRARNLIRAKHAVDELHLRQATSREFGLAEDPAVFVHEQRTAGSVLLLSHSQTCNTYWRDILNARFSHEVIDGDSRNLLPCFPANTGPDAIILHQTLRDGAEGLRLLSQIRMNPLFRQSAIIFVALKGDEDSVAKALELGANDYIFEGFDPLELAARLRCQIRYKKTSDKLRKNLSDGLKMAAVDPLTRLYNRRYVTNYLARLAKETPTPKTFTAALMLDLDNFKSINDRFGHSIGDQVLRKLAGRLTRNLRESDMVARMGGEEFLIIIPATSRAKAERIAERIRKSVEDKPFFMNDDAQVSGVTISIGVALSKAERRDFNSLLKRADHALFVSKHSGRNQVTFFARAA